MFYILLGVPKCKKYWWGQAYLVGNYWSPKLGIGLTNRFHDILAPNFSKPKGQLISKCPLGVIVLTKNQTIFFQDFCPSL